MEASHLWTMGTVGDVYVNRDDPQDAFAFRHLRVLKRPWDKARYFASIMFAPKPTDLDFVRLPPWLGFLYYVVRPPRLACKWSWRFLRAGFGRLKRNTLSS